MIRSLYRTQDGNFRTDLKPDEIGAALQDAHGLLWLDLASEPPEVCEPILRETFGFHHLAIEDALQQSHVPKMDDWTDYLLVVLHAVALNRDNAQLDSLELDAFLGKNYIVTYSERPIPAVERVWATCQRDERCLNSGPDHILYLLANDMVDGAMSVVKEMDKTIDRIMDSIFHRPTPDTLEQVFTLKRAVLHMRHTLFPQRKVFNKLARDDYAVIDARDRAYFRDVYDHLVRLYEINESLRDLVIAALDTHLSVVNNRMNESIKTLAAVAALFMPVSFLAGFFGMNFFGPAVPLHGLMGTPALALTLTVMTLSLVGMYVWIRRHR
jgi:magnesium transporter